MLDETLKALNDYILATQETLNTLNFSLDVSHKLRKATNKLLEALEKEKNYKPENN